MRFISVLLTCLAVLPLPARAHEFWIAPEQYQIAPGTPLRANLRVGEGFKGSPQSYFPQQFARFDVTMGEQMAPVEGRIGDIPAMNMTPAREGLAVVVHETRGHSLRYRDRALFERFVAHKDLGDVLARHVARGLPPLDFRESYTRYAKSLVGVGHGAGMDREIGLKTEIVALTNPYVQDVSDGFFARVLHNGTPRAGALVELFERSPDGAVEVTQHRTNAKGDVLVPVRAGSEYLIDAVVMEDTGNDDPAAGPVWHSAWASLTFKVPKP